MRASLGYAVVLVVAAGLVSACTKSVEPPTDVDPAATVERPGDAAPSESATPRRKAVRRAPAESTPSATSNAPGEDHPLASWMRGPATEAFDSGNLDAIAAAFERMAPWAPPGYANWASIATDGAQAARAGSVDGVKAACRGCHAEYESTYKATFATRPLS